MVGSVSPCQMSGVCCVTGEGYLHIYTYLHISAAIRLYLHWAAPRVASLPSSSQIDWRSVSSPTFPASSQGGRARDRLISFNSSTRQIFRYSKKQNSNHSELERISSFHRLKRIWMDRSNCISMALKKKQIFVRKLRVISLRNPLICGYLNSQICRREETTIMENVVWLKTPVCVRFNSPDRD